jgi:hypothetical protein
VLHSEPTATASRNLGSVPGMNMAEILGLIDLLGAT